MKFGESHIFMSFSLFKVLHEGNLPIGEVTTKARLHQGYIDSSTMRTIHEIHGLVTPYSPDILFQEERLSNIYQAFSPQEYNVLKHSLGLAIVNKHLDLEKAMKTIQWYKGATCPCHSHAIRRGGKIWQLRPVSMVPRETILQLPAISDSIILQRRRAKNQDLDQVSTMTQTSSASSISSDDTCIDLTNAQAEIAALDNEMTTEPGNESPYLTETENQFNLKMKKLFANPTIQQLFPCDTMALLNELCNQILAEAKKANPFKWVNFVQTARSEVDEIKFWEEQMKEDVDTMLSEFQKQLYTGLDVMFGELENVFREEKEHEDQEVKEIEEVD